MVGVLAVPPVTPIGNPEVALKLACEELLVDHVPPEVPSLRETTLPLHSVFVPAIAKGVAFTVTIAVDIQPDSVVYVIVDVPAVFPVTIPNDASIVTFVPDWLQVPPNTKFANVVVEPVQTVNVPVILATGFTVTAKVDAVHAVVL